MNKQFDSFETIAADAVDLLTAIVADLSNSKEEADQAAGAIIALATASFCSRAIALGAE